MSPGRAAAALGALVGLLAGCTGTAPPTTVEDLPMQECGDLVWERDVVGFFDNWCAPCHSASIVPPWRQGAPEGVNFDSLAGVRQYADRVVVTSLGDDPRMPPAGGPSDADRELVLRWISCGMPGTEVPVVEPCDAPVTVEGDVSVASQAEADAVCAGAPGVHLTGSLTVSGSAVFGCVCAVDGDLVLAGDTAASSVEAPLLTDVGGDFSLAGSSLGSLRLPELRTVGGTFTLDAQKNLVLLELPSLRTVGGPFFATHLGPLATLHVPLLLDVGGGFVVADGPVLADLQAPRLRTVGASIQYERLPLLTELEPQESLVSVPGDLVILETGVVHLDDLRGYQTLGTLRIASNPDLETVLGFWSILDVDAIEITDNPALTAIDGFTYLTAVPRLTVSGSPLLIGVAAPLLGSVGVPADPDSGLFLTDVPSLTAIDLPSLTNVTTLSLLRTGLVGMEGFASINALDALVVAENAQLLTVAGGSMPAALDRIELRGNPLLATFPGPAVLEDVSGDVVVAQNPVLTDLAGMGALTTVGGALDVSELALLPSVADFGSVTSVGGTLTLHALAHVATVAPLSGVESVGGDLVVTDNPVLPTADAEALAAAIDTIGGSVVITGNARVADRR